MTKGPPPTYRRSLSLFRIYFSPAHQVNSSPSSHSFSFLLPFCTSSLPVLQMEKGTNDVSPRRVLARAGAGGRPRGSARRRPSAGGPAARHGGATAREDGLAAWHGDAPARVALPAAHRRRWPRGWARRCACGRPGAAAGGLAWRACGRPGSLFLLL
jgi:hypothetical protein